MSRARPIASLRITSNPLATKPSAVIPKSATSRPHGERDVLLTAGRGNDRDHHRPGAVPASGGSIQECHVPDLPNARVGAEGADQVELDQVTGGAGGGRLAKNGGGVEAVGGVELIAAQRR